MHILPVIQVRTIFSHKIVELMWQLLPRIVFLGILSANCVWAQTDLPTVVVYSERLASSMIETGGSLVVVTQEEIRASGARNLGELLQGQAGLNLRNTSSDGAKAVIDMRGFGSTAGSNTLVLIDGRRLNNNSDLAPPDLAEIDLTNVASIEIIQGSAGTFFGSQAVGGVINVITRRPNTIETTVHTGAGSFNSYELQAATQGQAKTGLAYRLSVKKVDSDQYREHNHSNREQFALRFDQNYADWQLFFEQQLLHDNTQLPGSLFSDELAVDRRQSNSAYRGDVSTTETSISRLGLRHPFAANWLLNSDLSYRNNTVDFQLSGRGWPGTPSTQARKVLAFNPRISGPLNMGLDSVKLTLGSDVETTDYTLASAWGTQSEVQTDYAVYSQLAATMRQNWTVTLGLRYAVVVNDIDNNNTQSDLRDEVTVGSIGLAYEPLQNWQLFARWDQNYRFPTVDEHTNVLTGQPVGLKTQLGNSYELGLTYKTNTVLLQALGYQLNLRNEISFDSSTYFNINLPRTERQGAILRFTWTPVRAWNLGGDYTHTESSITSGPFAGRSLPLVPRHSGKLFVDYMATQNFSLRLTGNWTSKRRLGGDFANTFASLPSYEVISFATRYQKGPWHFSARIDNLLDREYSETGAIGFDDNGNLRDAYFPMSGRSFWLGVDYRL